MQAVVPREPNDRRQSLSDHFGVLRRLAFGGGVACDAVSRSYALVTWV
jgi:hypothetical protein